MFGWRKTRRTTFSTLRLSVEALELRAVPAGLVHDVVLPPDIVSGPYSSSVIAPDDILVSGTRQQKPVILELNGNGEVRDEVPLEIPEGRDAGDVVAISENG